LPFQTSDAGRQKACLLHELGHEPLRDRLGASPARVLRMRPPRPRGQSLAPPVDVEVAGDIPECPDAVSFCRETDQLFHRLLARWGRCIERGSTDDAFGDVVDALEAAAAGDGDETGIINM